MAASSKSGVTARNSKIVARNLLQDAIAGIIASVVLIANIVSFGALMFLGQLSAGIPVAIWAMLIGSAVGGIWIALATSLSPIASGIDSPTGTVLVLLSATAGSRILAAGASPQAAVQAIMLVFTSATFISGALLTLLGFFRLGAYFRFVPSSVVGGFFLATGCFLLAGGIRMATGRKFTFDALFAPWGVTEVLKVSTAVAALAILLLARRTIKSAFAMPATIVAMCLAAMVLLRVFGLSGSEHGWYFRSLGTLIRWSPFVAVAGTQLTFSMLVRLGPEIFIVAIVALISMITKVSSLEAARRTSADLDCELRANGIASLIAVPFGGISGSVQLGTTRLLEHLGGGKLSGVAGAATLGFVGVASFDLLGFIPIPVVCGLVFFLGYNFIADAVSRPYRQRAWFDLGLAGAIAVVCLQYSYLVGVLAGLVCACILFTMSYARLGAVRRHASRTELTSNVIRSKEQADYLVKSGAGIQLYWLCGYIFFGSSEGLFDRIRGDIEALPSSGAQYIIVDFAQVTGFDSSAILSLGKLRNFCRVSGVALIYSGLSPKAHRLLRQAEFFSEKNPCRSFINFQTALAWCEDQLLETSNIVIDTSDLGFHQWLQQRLGSDLLSKKLINYLERKDFADSQVIYREGAPSDTVDLVAAGTVNIDIATKDGGSKRVRRLSAHTVVGEMGFFRSSVRSATVSSEGAVTLFSLTRTSLERLRSEQPTLGSALDEYIIRVIADRLDATNREVSVL
jgi:sulfate permease, SulP family